MMELFAEAYEAVCKSLGGLVELLFVVLKLVAVIVIYLTIPLWLIPYAIIKRGRKNDKH